LHLITHRLLVLLAALLLATGASCTQNNEPTSAAPPATSTAPSAQAEAKPAPALAAPAPAATQPLTTDTKLAALVVPSRDLRDLAQRLRPGVDEVPLVVNEHVPDYPVGEQMGFWVHDLQTSANREITAQLLYKTDVAYAWVEAGQPHDSNAIIAAVDRFSDQSYPAVVAFFGSEWNPGVDNDPRLHILHTTGIGRGLAGYYSSADQYSRLANPYSNEKELFYINLDWLNTVRDYRYYETVLTHELQHMIHWHHDSNEYAWVNEGLSEFAQEVAGFGTDTVFVSAFVNRPDTQLNSWDLDGARRSSHYGASYLFIHYLHQRFGAGLLKTVVAEPANGIDGIQQALAAHGEESNFDLLFADWVVANFANQPDALNEPDRYGYRLLDFPQPVTEERFDHFEGASYASTVHNYATDYLRLDGAGDVLIHFNGQAETMLAPTQAPSGRMAWWSNRNDNSDTRLTRQFDLTGLAPTQPVTLEAHLWWDIEEHYDFGYVLASTDGAKWTILPGQRTTTENPSGNSFGAGYTGKSDPTADGAPRWVTEEFDLSPFAGEKVWVRFEYITDDAVTSIGWLIDEVRIPALGYETDFEGGADGWASEGWLYTDNRLAQGWLVQVLEFTGDELTGLHRYEVDENGQATFAVPGLGNGRRAVLAISALAPITTEPAAYEVRLEVQ
jgi:immune inhibitor A